MKAITLILAAIAATVIATAMESNPVANATVVYTFLSTYTNVYTSESLVTSIAPVESSVSTICAATDCSNGTDAASSNVFTTITMTTATTNTVYTDTTANVTTVFVMTTLEPPPVCTASSDSEPSPSIAATITATVYPIPATLSTTDLGPFASSSSDSNLSLTYESSNWTIRPSCSTSTTWTVTTITAVSNLSDPNTYTTFLANDPPSNATGIVVYNNATETVSSTSQLSSTSSSAVYYTGSPIFTSSGKSIKTPFFFGIIARLLSLTKATTTLTTLPSVVNEENDVPVVHSKDFARSTSVIAASQDFLRVPIPIINALDTVRAPEIDSTYKSIQHESQESAKPQIAAITSISLGLRSDEISPGFTTTVTEYTTEPNVVTDWFESTTVTTTVYVDATTTNLITIAPSQMVYSTWTIAPSSTKTVTAGGDAVNVPNMGKISYFFIGLTVVAANLFTLFLFSFLP